ncbi:MAG: hypothetical protein ACYDC3_09125 [Candidatus Binataceae bacterium]
MRVVTGLMVSLALVFIGGLASAFDFEDICPVQAPPTWTATAWSQFRDSCIADDSAHDRHLVDDCLRKCASADQAEGIKPKIKPFKLHSAPGEAPLNPNWCSSVPASPAPPHFENRPGDWAQIRQGSMNTAPIDVGCRDACEAAEELWTRKKLHNTASADPGVIFDTNCP